MSSKRISDLPGPKGLPAVGSIREFFSPTLHQHFEHWADEFGSLYRVHFLMKNYVIVSSGELVEEVLRNRPENYRRFSAMSRAISELQGEGVFSAEGESWKRQRRLIMPAFQKKSIRTFYSRLEEITVRFQDYLMPLSEQDSGVNIRKDFRKYTLDTVGGLAFGYDINSLQDKNRDLRGYLKYILPALGLRSIMPFPYWRYIKLPKDRQLDEAIAAIEHKASELVVHAQSRLKENGNEPETILEAMLLASQQDDLPFSEKELMGNILTLLLAGEDTTADVLTWVMFYMAEYPVIQEKVFKEVQSVLKGEDRMIGFEEMDQFPYLQAVISETLRLRGVVPVLFLESLKKQDLGGTRLSKGTPVCLLTRHVGMQEEFFPNAKQFLPDRWLPENAGELCKVPKFMLPFGGGARICPGQLLSLIEMKLAISMMVRNFHVSRAKKHLKVEETMGFTMKPQNFYVHLSKR